jgi:sialate O-acetylesterase
MTLKLDDVFTDNAVFQRRSIIPVSGYGKPDNNIFIKFGDVIKNGKVDKDGKWVINLPEMEASNISQKLIVQSYEKCILAEEVIINNILIGDVWFCSGQSNMEMGITSTENGINEAKNANFSEIRYLLINKTSSSTPTKKLNAVWKTITPENIIADGWGGFSAIAYYFGKTVYKEINVPLGLIQSAFGGSSIHPWIIPEYLSKYKVLFPYYREYIKAKKEYQKNLKIKKDIIHPFENFKEYNELKPSTTYNAMVHPIITFPIKGVLWYQGESDLTDGIFYADKLKALSESFRSVWKNDKLPFFFAQIAPYNYDTKDKLLNLWEGFYKAEKKIKYSGLIITIDVGDINDIHPIKKRQVGERFALFTLSKTYGRKNIYNGPKVKNCVFEKNKAIITFDFIGSGLISIDKKPLRWFELSDDNKCFYQADAIIVKDMIIVESKLVNKPAFVRYGWSGVIENVNFYNKEGLPARPFKF